MNEFFEIAASLCARGLVRCTGLDADGFPTYEATEVGREIIAMEARG